MEKKTSIIITSIIGIIATILIFKIFDLGSALEMMQGASFLLILSYLVITVLIIGTMVWRWKIIIQAVHKETPNYWELMRYFLIAYGISYITPGAKVGGEIFRVGLLSQHCNYKKASSTVFIDKTIEMTAMGGFFVLGLAILLIANALPAGSAFWMISIGILLIALISLFYHQMFTGNDFIGKLFRFTKLHKTKIGKKLADDIYDFEKYVITFYNKEKKVFTYTIVLSFISWALTFVEFWIVLSILGVSGITLLKLFLVITFIGAAYVIPLPMALGSLEAGQVSVFKMIGMPGAAGIGVAIITRAKDIILSIIGLSFMGYYGLHLGKNLKEALPFVESEKGKKDKKKISWNF